MRDIYDLQAFAEWLGEKISSPNVRGEAHYNAWAEDVFNRLALNLYELQFRSNPAYRRFCESREAHPGTLSHWTTIPSIPTEAFKELPLTSIAEPERKAVFHSSGTAGQKPSRHYHCQASLRLYESSLWSWFAPHLLAPGSIHPSWVLALTPRREEAPLSSLVHMFECISSHLNLDSTFFACRPATDGGWAIEGRRTIAFLEDTVCSGKPGLVLTTAFGLVQLSDLLAAHGRRLNLPRGSRVMETGGYKGRSRTMPKAELHDRTTQWLGVPADNIVIEYGMSELSSQAYNHTAGNLTREGHRIFHFPPWARARVVSPETGDEVADGETGLLRVFDLGNVFSVSAIHTGDLGVRHGDGFELIGRAGHLDQRGCSLLAIT
jgi:hypothetical protein